MAPAVDPFFGFIVAFASLIVVVTWLVAAGLVWLFLRRKVEQMRKEHGELPKADATALLFYALSVFFWPAGFVLGAVFLGKPATALQGRNCILITLADLSLVVVLTCIGMTVAGFLAPGWFAGL
jgi:hypothetical protein